VWAGPPGTPLSLGGLTQISLKKIQSSRAFSPPMRPPIWVGGPEGFLRACGRGKVPRVGNLGWAPVWAGVRPKRPKPKSRRGQQKTAPKPGPFPGREKAPISKSNNALEIGKKAKVPPPPGGRAHPVCGLGGRCFKPPNNPLGFWAGRVPERIRGCLAPCFVPGTAARGILG